MKNKELLCFKYFISTIILGFIVLVLIEYMSVKKDPFFDNEKLRRNIMPLLAAEDIVEIKINHALNTPRYDIGLFGNSRIISLSKNDIGFPQKRFFNFGVGATSFRTSVRTIERLHELGKLPQVVVISFDNLQVMQPPRPPLYQGFINRWADASGDILYAIKHNNAPLENILLHIKYESKRLLLMFKSARFRYLIHYWILPIYATHHTYRTDGGLPESLPEKRKTFKPIQEYAPLFPALNLDMKKIGRIARDNETRIIVYESPLHPALIRYYRENPNPNAVVRLESFKQACIENGLECYLAPIFNDDLEPPFWNDSSHAPAAILGSFVSSLIKGERRGLPVR